MWTQRLAVTAHDESSRSPRLDSITLPTWLCTICQTLFANPCNLRRHVASKHDNRTFTCPTCSKTFTRKGALKRHIETHEMIFTCHLCTKVFRSKSILTNHVKTHIQSVVNTVVSKHGTETFSCEICSRTFTRKDALKRHTKTHEVLYPCDQCGEVFGIKKILSAHVKTHTKLCIGPHLPSGDLPINTGVDPSLIQNVPLMQPGDPAPSTDPRLPPSAICPPSTCKSALGGSVKRYRTRGGVDYVDLISFLKILNHGDRLRDAVMEKKGVKFYVTVNIRLRRPSTWLSHGDREVTPYFTSRCSRVLGVTDIDHLLELAYTKVADDLEKWLRNGSGWVIEAINFVDITIITYKPL